jgi:serine/threonine-protein kinase RsbW
VRVSVDDRSRLLERGLARAEGIGPLRRAVVEFARRCGASQEQCDDIAVAVSEALSNVVEHAYAGRGSPGPMTVEASRHERLLIVVVSDDGVGMRARDTPGVGMGLRLIFDLTARLEFEDTVPGSRARMTFAIG